MDAQFTFNFRDTFLFKVRLGFRKFAHFYTSTRQVLKSNAQNLAMLSIYVVMPPIEYDEFGFILEGSYEEEPATAPEPEVVEPIVPIREQFPLEGTEYLGGKSDGWEYRTVFAGGRLAVSYLMVLTFLEEHGYSDVPVPANAEELQLFRRQRTPQLQLFPERGYVHNPIKILFHTDPKMRNALVLCIYNEKAPNHLLKFHGVLRPQKKEPQS